MRYTVLAEVSTLFWRAFEECFVIRVVGNDRLRRVASVGKDLGVCGGPWRLSHGRASSLDGGVRVVDS